MAPKQFEETAAAAAAAYGPDYTLIGGPDIVGRPGFQAALYSGTNPETLKNRQLLFVADTVHGGTDFERSLLLFAQIDPNDEGYCISGHRLRIYDHLGSITVAYPTSE